MLKIIKIKKVALLLVILSISFIFLPQSSAATTIPIYIDNTLVISDVEPFVVNGTTMVPIRFIASELGAEVKWRNPDVLINFNSKQIVLTVGKKTAIVDGKELQLTIAPEIRNSRTFVPLRFVAESMGVDVDYVMGEVYVWKTSFDLPHSGNVQNGGKIVENETTIFWSENEAIYKKDKSTGVVEKIALVFEESTDWRYRTEYYSNFRCLNLKGDILHCAYRDQVLSIDIKSGATTPFAWRDNGGLEGSVYVQIYGNNMYGIWSAGKYNNSFILSLDDGSFRDLPTGSLPTALCIDKNYIYTELGLAVYEPGILKMPLNGRTSSSVRIYQDKVLGGLSLHGEKLYFISSAEATNNQLCRINKDGSGFEIVLPEKVYTYNISGNTLYYSLWDNIEVSLLGNTYNSDVPGDLYKMDLVSKTVTKIAEGHIAQIYVISDGIYYFDRDYSNPPDNSVYNYHETMIAQGDGSVVLMY